MCTELPVKSPVSGGMWEPEQQSSLSVRHIKPSDDPFITKIEPIPPSLESRISKYAFSIATSYFHRLNMFPDSYGNVVVDEKNEQPIGACGAGKKTVRIGGKIDFFIFVLCSSSPFFFFFLIVFFLFKLFL